MSKSEKRWRRFYMILMLFIYIIVVPVMAIDWLGGSGGFPYTAIIVGTALPLIRKNHLNAIRHKELHEAV
ncbi:hypothetical protein [Alkalibacillus silvisoli]|uniref:Uncharacterized protein n=1 Tax=Alkalibacillus silvisoli TaxID=392823 RepID=A0ABN1A2A4_9BACI